MKYKVSLPFLNYKDIPNYIIHINIVEMYNGR